ncbi:MAG: type II toxin-antitoxin system RelE/ParE family toxin [Thermomicrobiales bacterium]
MEWDVEGTDTFKEWFLGLTDAEDIAVSEAINALMTTGPSLGRPFVDTLSGSRIPNLKELRPKRNNIRILFAFDPRRTAILLLGGSKTNDWQGWYKRNGSTTTISRN